MSKERGKTYLVGGVNGVGKSTFIERLISSHPEFEAMNGSGALREWLGLKPGDYDGLRKLPDGLKRAETEKMMRYILQDKNRENKTLIVDAHYLHYKGGALIDVTGEWMAYLDALFVITAPAGVILGRIDDDKVNNGKLRDLFPPNIQGKEERIAMLNDFIAKTNDKAREVSRRYNVNCFFVDNGREGVQAAVNEFLNYHTSLQEQN